MWYNGFDGTEIKTKPSIRHKGEEMAAVKIGLSFRKKLFIILIIMGGILLCTVAVLFVGARLRQSRFMNEKTNEWINMAVEHLQQQEEIADRYSNEYIFDCTLVQYGYEKGEPMYYENNIRVPTDIVLTIEVYKGPIRPMFNLDEYTVYLLRNHDGTYRVERYEIKNKLGH